MVPETGRWHAQTDRLISCCGTEPLDIVQCPRISVAGMHECQDPGRTTYEAHRRFPPREGQSSGPDAFITHRVRNMGVEASAVIYRLESYR